MGPQTIEFKLRNGIFRGFARFPVEDMVFVVLGIER